MDDNERMALLVAAVELGWKLDRLSFLGRLRKAAMEDFAREGARIGTGGVERQTRELDDYLNSMRDVLIISKKEG